MIRGVKQMLLGRGLIGAIASGIIPAAVVSSGNAQADDPKTGSLSANVAAAISVAVTDYLHGEEKQGRAGTPSAFAKRNHALAYKIENDSIEIHVLEGTSDTFGGGVSYVIDLGSLSIRSRRFGR